MYVYIYKFYLNENKIWQCCKTSKRKKKNWFRILQRQQGGINATKRDDRVVCEAKLRAIRERWIRKIIEIWMFWLCCGQCFNHYQFLRHHLVRNNQTCLFSQIIWTWNNIFFLFIFTIWLRTRILNKLWQMIRKIT